MTTIKPENIKFSNHKNVTKKLSAVTEVTDAEPVEIDKPAGPKKGKVNSDTNIDRFKKSPYKFSEFSKLSSMSNLISESTQLMNTRFYNKLDSTIPACDLEDVRLER